MNKILVSIIVNCLNGEKFLEETLQSVINQTYKNWELIFWDNQSSDKSFEIFREINHPKFNYYYAPVQTSLGEARELAFKKSKGEWIGFLDCDDIWLPDKLRDQVEIINSYKGKLGLIYSKCRLFKDIRNKTNDLVRKTAIQPCSKKLPTLKIYSDLLKGNFIPFPSLLYKREAIIKSGNFSCYKFSPDYYLNLSIAFKYDSYAIDKVLCLYRFHEANLSKSIRETGILEAIKIIYRLHPKNQADIYSKTHKVRYIVYLLMKGNFRKTYKIFNELGTCNLISGFFEILRYYLTYKTKI
ncbi:glycosyltransferase [Prochlorococcus sp. AH-716-E13]|nr:glycosyltransferase [Prochlorococcus sp. AH-716-E13]